MRKSKNRVYRWIATMLTAALLVGQCRVPVLAEEETVPAEAEISEEDKSGAQESGTDGTENDAAEDGEEGADQNGTDNDDGDGGKEESGADDIATGDEGEDKDGEEGSQEKCICETVCTEDAVNGDCPVCAADYANCAKNAGGEVNLPEENGGEDTVSENDLAGKENAVLMAVDEGVTTLAVGDDFTYGKIRYVVTGDGEVEVGRQNANAVSGSLMIPNYVEDNKRNRYRVTSIGESAFFKCSNLTSVTIPNSVTTIKKAAFNDCGITSVTISDSVTSIGYAAFAVCKRLRKVEIPKNVKSIEDYTFSGCDELTSVTLPDSVTSIGKDAFPKGAKIKKQSYLKSVSSKYVKSKHMKENYSYVAMTAVTDPDTGKKKYYEIDDLAQIYPKEEKIRLKKRKKVRLWILTEIQLPMDQRKEGYLSPGILSYRSSNPKVVKVSKKGVVKVLKKKGTATIRVKLRTDGLYEWAGDCKVKVKVKKGKIWFTNAFPGY